MALDINIKGSTTGTAEVNSSGQLKIVPEVDVNANPTNVGCIRIFGENDSGSATGTPRLRSPEVDVDYRMRVSQDLIYEEEVFNYTAQNTGKHQYLNTTMTAAWTAGQLTTNAAGITTAATAVVIRSYAYFPNTGTQTLSFDFEAAFGAQPVSNTVIDFGGGITGAANPYAPTDGAFFRLTAAGLFGVINYNGSETQSGMFESSPGVPWTYTNDKRYQFICYLGGIEAQFWINDGTGPVLMGSIPMPIGNSRICMSGAVPWFVRHAITGGAAAGVMQFKLGAVNVRVGGSNTVTTVSTQGQRIYGAYQGLSGSTLGTLALLPNNANPAAAVPTNTTAALGVGLGGQFLETDTLAVNTDGIIGSYQVPVGTANVQGRKLVVRGVKICSHVQTALTGGGYVATWTLAFGHTTVSLATAEGASTKAARRIGLGKQAVAAGAAVGTLLTDVYLDLGDSPVFVNPGEFVAVTKRKSGAAPTAGAIDHLITVVYGWE